MKDLSERSENKAVTAKQKWYPSLNIKADVLPGIKQEVGSKGFLKVEYEVKSVTNTAMVMWILDWS